MSALYCAVIAENAPQLFLYSDLVIILNIREVSSWSASCNTTICVVQERLEAMERERCREELRKLDAEEERAREEEAERKRQKRLEEALQRRKAREEQQQKLRQEEESNWEKAMSGELKGRRKAAIGAAENVSEVQRLTDDFLIADKDFDLYTAMHKSEFFSCSLFV